MISLTYLYSKFFKKILRGRCVVNSQIHPTSHVDSATEFHNSTMEKYSYVGYDSQVYNTQIGPFCSIGDFFLCGGATHPMDWLSTSSAFYGGGNVGNSKKLAYYKIPSTKRTVIGADVWVGARATIVAGVNVGVGAVIGTGSVVTRDVPPYAIVAGVPAKVIKYRFPEDVIKKLLESRWWELPDEVIKEAATEFKNPIMFLEKIKSIVK